MSSPAFGSVRSLEYSDVSRPVPDVVETIIAAPVGVPEAVVEQRIAAACAAERLAVEQRLRREFDTREATLRQGLTETLARFADERFSYFAAVEQEVVHLALAVARKILGREAQLDPMLLAGLVRIALDGMQSGPATRLRVAPQQVATWQACADSLSARHRAEIVADATLEASECVIETDIGSARLSFETQLKEVERGFLDLIGRRPDRPELVSRGSSRASA